MNVASNRESPAANQRVLPLKGRPIPAFLRALVGAFKAGNTFFREGAGFGGDLSAATNLVGGKTPLTALIGFS